ncbi:DUF2884 family protein [Ferrimonas marina]|uniref:DUF2884 family protein n=1 Tax=Ferrimonas marina TaxID=299255 RepID=A0A1M5YDI9_9GAMM|nr:DUF2884 family protein [Ferrimonas marina]SHI10056.1 Protein of unknown function [Ferrimonas marina]
MNKLLLPLLSLGLLCSAHASDFAINGEQCDLNLNHDLHVNQQTFSVSDGERQLYRFDQGQLYVEQKPIHLSEEQRQALERFQQELMESSEELVALVDEGLALAAMALEEVFAELSQWGVEQPDSNGLMQKVQQRVHGEMQDGKGGYTLSQSSLNSMDEELDKAIEDEIEQVVSQSVGSMLMMLGSAIANGEGESFEAKMESFGRSMEAMGERIEQQVGSHAEQIEQQAQGMCERWMALDEQEQQLQRIIPEINAYDLIVSGDPDLAWLR